MFEGFQFPKTMIVWMDAHSGAAGWAQAVIAGLAIASVYYAATIPVRAEARRLDEERFARADGLRLLLLPEIMTLQGELEAAIESGSILDPTITVSSSLMDRADQMYLMGETGRRLLQALGMINGMAAQLRRFNQICDDRNIVFRDRQEEGAPLWSNCLATYKLCHLNLGEVIGDM